MNLTRIRQYWTELAPYASPPAKPVLQGGTFFDIPNLNLILFPVTTLSLGPPEFDLVAVTVADFDFVGAITSNQIFVRFNRRISLKSCHFKDKFDGEKHKL
jgi:hypothetical protein